MAALNAQRYNLTASDAELNARIAAAQQAAENDDSRYGGRNTLKAITPLVAEQNRRAATATLADPSATPAQIWAARQVVTPSTIGATRAISDDQPELINSADAQALALANAHAAQNTPQWQAAVNAYNTGQIVPAEFVPLLNRLNAYYQQGQAAPGNLAPTTAGEAIRQWGIDAQPSGLGGILGIVGSVAAIALAPATGGASLAMYGAVGGAVGAAIGGGDPIKGALGGALLGFGAGALGVGGAAAAETTSVAAATEGIAVSGAGVATGAPTLGSLSLTDAAINAGLTNTIGSTGLATTAAVDAGIAAAGTVTPFGGAIVGTNGVLGTTGNAIIDGAANSAMSSVTKNAAVNVLTGNDPFANAGNAALGGAAFGGVGAAIPDNLNLTGNSLVDSSLSGAANGALPAGAAALATGGDVGNALVGGGLIGAGTPLVNAGVNLIAPQDEVPRINSALTSTAQGALVGGVSAGVGGGDIINGMVVGGIGGLGGNLAGQAVDYLSNGSIGAGTFGNTLAQTAGTVVGQVIGNNLAPSGTPIPAASPVYTNFVQPGTMSNVDSMLNPNHAGGLINNYQSLAVRRANQSRI